MSDRIEDQPLPLYTALLARVMGTPSEQKQAKEYLKSIGHPLGDDE